MNSLTLTQVINGIRDLPSLPVLVLELLNSFESDDISVGDLAGKVSRDQALAAKTLRLANSSFYGLSRKVTTIQQAITILGFDCVRTLVAAAALTDAFADCQHGVFGFDAFWRHSIGTAVCAKLLAREVGVHQDYAFLSGLLHDIGKLVLVTRFPEQYLAVLEYRSRNDCYMIDAERAVLQLDHPLVGRALAEHWKFPTLIQKAIASHHAPPVEEALDVPGVVHVADAIAHALDFGGEEHALVPVVADGVWRRMALSSTALRAVFHGADREFHAICQILATSH